MLLINCGGAQKDFFHGVLKVGWIFIFFDWKMLFN